MLQKVGLIGLLCFWCLVTFASDPFSQINFYIGIENYERALKILESSKFEDVQEQLYLEGFCLNRLENYEKALQKLKQAQSNNRQNKLLFREIGIAFWGLCKYEEALENLNQGQMDDPLNLKHRGQVYLKLKNYEAASQDFENAEKVVANSDELAEILYYHTSVLLMQEEIEVAKAKLEKSKNLPMSIALKEQYDALDRAISKIEAEKVDLPTAMVSQEESPSFFIHGNLKFDLSYTDNATLQPYGEKVFVEDNFKSQDDFFFSFSAEFVPEWKLNKHISLQLRSGGFLSKYTEFEEFNQTSFKLAPKIELNFDPVNFFVELSWTYLYLEGESYYTTRYLRTGGDIWEASWTSTQLYYTGQFIDYLIFQHRNLDRDGHAHTFALRQSFYLEKPEAIFYLGANHSHVSTQGTSSRFSSYGGEVGFQLFFRDAKVNWNLPNFQWGASVEFNFLRYHEINLFSVKKRKDDQIVVNTTLTLEITKYLQYELKYTWFHTYSNIPQFKTEQSIFSNALILHF